MEKKMNIEDVLNDEKIQKDELIRNIAIGAIGMIPFAGGPLSVLLDKYLPSTLQKRRDQFINDLASDLENLPKETIQKLLVSDEYHSLLIKTCRTILQENKKEKIYCFRNILLNTAINEDCTSNEIDFYSKLIQELSIDQIRILHLFYLKEYKKTLHFDKINDYLSENWKDIDKDYRFALVTELMRYGIIKYYSDEESEHRLNSFGKRFIGFIFSPIEL